MPSRSASSLPVATGCAWRLSRSASSREVGEAIDLNDPDLLEVAEHGRIALPFEIILRLAAILGRKDPIGFVVRLTRSSNPELWKTMEALGVGKLVVQSARELFGNVPPGTPSTGIWRAAPPMSIADRSRAWRAGSLSMRSWVRRV